MALSEEAKLLVRISAENATQRTFAEFEGQLNNLKSTVMKVAAVIGGALAFKDVMESTSRFGDEITRLRDNFGLTATDASRLNYAAKAMGVTNEQLISSYSSLNSQVATAAEAMRKQAEGLIKQRDITNMEKWGVAIFNAKGQILPFDQILQNVKTRFEEMPNGVAKSQMAMDLFGDSGRGMIEFMNLAPDKLHALMKEAEDFGLVMNDSGVDAIAEFNKNMNRLGLQLEGVKVQLGNALMPVLSAVITQVRNAAGAVKALGEAFRVPLGIIKEVIARFVTFAEDIRKEGFGAALAQLATDIISKVGELLGNVGDWATTNGPKWLAAIGDLFGKMTDWIKTDGWPTLVTFMETKVPEFANWIVLSIPEWSSKLGDLLAVATSWVTTDFIPGFIGAFFTIQSKIGEWGANVGIWLTTEALPKMLQGAVNVGAGIVSGILTAFAGWDTKLERALGDAFSNLNFDVGPFHMHDGTFTVDLMADFNLGTIIPWFNNKSATGPPGNSNQPPKAPPGSGTSLVPGVDRNGNPGAWGSDGFHPAGGGPVTPGFAAGGIAMTPQVTSVAERGPEAIIPLSQMGGLGNSYSLSISVGTVDSHARVDELADAVADRLMTLTNGMGSARYR